MLGLLTEYLSFLPAQDAQQKLDPQKIQPGETIFDPSGASFSILPTDNPGLTNEVMVMPTDQQGKPLPEGVEELDVSELSTFTTQPPAGQGVQKAVMASIEEEAIVDVSDGRDGYTSILSEVVGLADRGHEKGDIILALNEKTPDKDLLEGVLEDATELGFL